VKELSMKRIYIAIVLGAFVVGCNNGEEKKPSSDKKTDTSVTAKSTTTAPAPLVYQEVKVGNNVYVVGSAAAAKDAQAGKLKQPVRAIGYGAPDEKVYFDSANEAALRAEYEKRHNMK
jgi:hypothetical protein